MWSKKAAAKDKNRHLAGDEYQKANFHMSRR